MILMALDHVRMYFGQGTWYADPTNLATTTPLLFFTRWITHFCAPVFVFLAGVSAFLYGQNQTSRRSLAWFLLNRGLWLIFVEVVIVNLAWTFDVTYSLIILQVIWAIGIGMVALSVLVFLPAPAILVIGIALIAGHNLLDPITVRGSSVRDLIWYALHQPTSVFLEARLVSFVYPVLPWIGVMALGYVTGTLYGAEIPAQARRRRLLVAGSAATLLFLLLRGFNLYGEPHPWQPQDTSLFSVLSFLNTTKYPPSLHFLLMTMGPALMGAAALEATTDRLPKPVIVFGSVPFFFYLLHLYVIHALGVLWLVSLGREGGEYILSAAGIRSGALSRVGLPLEAVYVIWILLVLALYPACRWYQLYRARNPTAWWLKYL
jgi:uncharacterized membrane protein